MKAIFVASLFFLFFLANASGDIIVPIPDGRTNFFGETPPASYGDWTYFSPAVWLGSYKTSASPVGDVGPDDGISFGSLSAGSTGTLAYTIKTGSYSGLEYFYVWADWSNDGAWLDTGELIVDLDLTVSANSTFTNTASFSIPAYWNSQLVGGDIWFNAVVSPDNSTAGISGSWARGEQEALRLNVQPIPEPSTFLMIGLGVLLLLIIGTIIRVKKK